jgi:hypothetical protein
VNLRTCDAVSSESEKRASGASGMAAIRDAVLSNVAPLPSTHRVVRPALNGCRSRSTVCPPVASEVSSYEGREDELGAGAQFVPIDAPLALRTRRE